MAPGASSVISGAEAPLLPVPHDNSNPPKNRTATTLSWERRSLKERPWVLARRRLTPPRISRGRSRGRPCSLGVRPSQGLLLAYHPNNNRLSRYLQPHSRTGAGLAAALESSPWAVPPRSDLCFLESTPTNRWNTRSRQQRRWRQESQELRRASSFASSSRSYLVNVDEGASRCCAPL